MQHHLLTKTPSEIIDNIILIEGGYVNDPDDRGGETKYGITKDVARAYGYKGPMIDLPKMTAKLIYIRRYWTDPGFAEISKQSKLIAIELFDSGVNAGTTRAAKWLQRLLNVFTDLILIVDGRIGPMTLNALMVYLQKRGNQDGEMTMYKTLNAIQGCHYINLAEKDPSQRRFVYGWCRNRL